MIIKEILIKIKSYGIEKFSNMNYNKLIDKKIIRKITREDIISKDKFSNSKS